MFNAVSPEGSVQLDPVDKTRNIEDMHAFTCSAQGGPNNTFQWFFNGNLATNRQVSSSPTESNYTISNVSVLDGGQYTCVVSNAAGNSSETSTLFVSPRIIANPASQILSSNGSLEQLVCEAEAFPAPTYTWTKLTGPNSPVVVVEFNSSGLLTLQTDFGSEGAYVCTASSRGLSVNSTQSVVYGE